MTRSKGRAGAKTRARPKTRSKATRAKPAVNQSAVKSKQATVLTLLNRPGGATVSSHSPWPPPFAPPAPQPVARLCSSASQLLWRSSTSHVRSSLAPAPRLPNADQRMREWPDLGPPGSRSRSFDTCQVLRPRRAARPCDIASGDVAFRLRNSVGTRNYQFRGSMAGLCPPLPTLRRRPCGRQRTARGRCGSLLLHRVGLHRLLLAGLPAALRIRYASVTGFKLRWEN